jgi:hypothetical protein
MSSNLKGWLKAGGAFVAAAIPFLVTMVQKGAFDPTEASAAIGAGIMAVWALYHPSPSGASVAAPGGAK